MAWSSTTVAAADLARLAIDLPLVVPQNAVSFDTPPQWNFDTGSFLETNYLNAIYPPKRAADGFAHSYTKPDHSLSGVNTIWFLMVLDPTIDFDTLCILGHNFEDIATGYVFVDLQIADDATFATNLETLLDDDVQTNVRYFSADLRHTGSTPRVYSGVTYARLKLTTNDASDFIGLPQIGEVWLGKRQQLCSAPLEPFTASDSTVTITSEFRGDSGADVVNQLSGARRTFDARWRESDSTAISRIRSVHSLSGGGSRPILWVDTPGSAPRPYFGRIDPSFAAPYVDGPTRELALSFRELKPFYFDEAGV